MSNGDWNTPRHLTEGIPAGLQGSFLAMSNRFPLPDALTAEILAEARRDYLGLWWIVRKLRERLPGLSASEQRIATLEFLRPLLESGDLVAGEPGREAQTF